MCKFYKLVLNVVYISTSYLRKFVSKTIRLPIFTKYRHIVLN